MYLAHLKTVKGSPTPLEQQELADALQISLKETYRAFNVLQREKLIERVGHKGLWLIKGRSSVMDLTHLQALEGENWITLRQHPDLPLLVANYTAKTHHREHWTGVTEMCRGLVIDSKSNVVSRPLKRFGHLGKYNIPKEKPLIYDKVDGSLIIVSTYQNQRIVNSRSSFDNQHVALANKLLQDWMPEEGYTYCFELIHPEVRIVCDYGKKEALVLLAKIQTSTGNEILLDDVEDWDGDKAAQKALNWPLEALDTWDGSEGYVLYWPDDGIRAKVKHAEYVRLHGLLTGITSKTIYDTLKEGKNLDELRENVPDEFLDWLDAKAEILQDEYRIIYEEAQIAFEHLEVFYHDRAAFSLAIRDSPLRSVLFAILDGRNPAKLIWKLIDPPKDRPYWNDQ